VTRGDLWARIKDRRLLLGLGAGLAGLCLVSLAAWQILGPDPDEGTVEGPAQLTVQTGLNDDVKLDPGRPLKCFVNGQAVGDLLLIDCARRNGVDPGALDVGLDASGALGASNGLTSALTPLPPPGESPPHAEATTPGDEPPSPSPPTAQTATAGGLRPLPAVDSPGPCWRYGDGGWSRLPQDTPLGSCVQALYAGQCEPPGAVAYGRWRNRTLRLVSGRVEMLGDDHAFRLIAPQKSDCSIPSMPF
jgi:hypothetical protein